MGNTIVCKDIRIPTWTINVTMTKLSKSTWRETRDTKICMILSRFLLKTYSWFQTETLEFLLSPGLTLVSCVLCNDANNTWISIIISSILLYFNFKFIATGSKVSDFFTCNTLFDAWSGTCTYQHDSIIGILRPIKRSKTWKNNFYCLNLKHFV